MDLKKPVSEVYKGEIRQPRREKVEEKMYRASLDLGDLEPNHLYLIAILEICTSNLSIRIHTITIYAQRRSSVGFLPLPFPFRLRGVRVLVRKTGFLQIGLDDSATFGCRTDFERDVLD